MFVLFGWYIYSTIVWDKIEDWRKILIVQAKVKDLISKRDVRQDGCGVINLLHSKPHHLEHLITWHCKWLPVERTRKRNKWIQNQEIQGASLKLSIRTSGDIFSRLLKKWLFLMLLLSLHYTDYRQESTSLKELHILTWSIVVP